MFVGVCAFRNNSMGVMGSTVIFSLTFNYKSLNNTIVSLNLGNALRLPMTKNYTFVIIVNGFKEAWHCMRFKKPLLPTDIL